MANDYWRRRIQSEQEAKIERGATLSDEMDRLYQHHFKALETEIMAFEQRYANKNGIPISEVKSKVSDFDVKAFEEKAKRYVEEKNFSHKANAELELYNLKMKINRLELLQYQLDLEMVALSEAEHKLTDKFLNGEYIRTLEEQSGLLGQSVLNIRQVENVAQTVINTPFKGAVWSDRIWERQTMLRTIVAQMTEDYLLKGKNPTTMISKIRKEFGVSASEAKRLAVTEGARVATEAEKQSYFRNGYDEYEFIAEPSACKFCKPLDGKIFKVKDMEPGENAAPMHPHCHCSTAAHFSMDKAEYERLIEESADSIENQPFEFLEITKDNIGDVKRATEVANRFKNLADEYERDTGKNVLEMFKNKQLTDRNNPYNDEKNQFMRYVYEKIGYNKLPQVISKQEAERWEKVYRGVHDTKDGSISSETFKQNFRQGQMDLSGRAVSVHGRGLYFGSENIARKYANNGDNPLIFDAYIPDNFKHLNDDIFVDEKRYWSDKKTADIKNLDYYFMSLSNIGLNDSNVDLFAILHGYDGNLAAHFDGVYQTVYNRSKLGVIKDD